MPKGHTVHALTLPGLVPGDDVSGVEFGTHIAAAAAVVADLDDVRLVGHSYGGMIVSAVADRLSDRVDSVVYLDAFVPRDGENRWTQTNDEERAWYADDDGSGFAVGDDAVLRRACAGPPAGHADAAQPADR